MKNSAYLKGCCIPREKAEVDNAFLDLQNSSYLMKAKFNNCFIIQSKYLPTPTTFAILLFVFPLTKNNLVPCNLQWAALWTLVQYDKTFDIIGLIWQSSFQIWSTVAGYGELCV